MRFRLSKSSLKDLFSVLLMLASCISVFHTMQIFGELHHLQLLAKAKTPIKKPHVEAPQPTETYFDLHGSSIYLEDSHEERPLFTFVHRPWKSESAIFHRSPCERPSAPLWSMVFVIKSAIKNTLRRQAIRQTWGGIKNFDQAVFEIVFVLGNSTDSETMKEIADENSHHGDILQFYMPDAAEYVPEKVLAGMQWASDLPHDWLYASIDDDIGVHHKNLNDFYTKLIEESVVFTPYKNFSNMPIVCAYNYQSKDPPSRAPSSKWFVPLHDYNGQYWPPYCRGGMYTISVPLVKKLFEVSRRTSRLYLDDVWITGFMRLKVERTNDNIIPAPGAVLDSWTERMRSPWHKGAVVWHFWGNIEAIAVNVEQKLRESWKNITYDIFESVTCFKT